jgi:DNA invertase Pin-like site-specific DNA recombinase
MRRTVQPHALPAADVIGYIRVSTDDQAREDKASLEQQRAAIRGLAAKLDRALDDAMIFDDPGASGRTAERPGFQRLLAYCAAHRRSAATVGYVLVLNDSRFGRFAESEESAYWRVHLKKLGWVVRFAEGDETQDATARPLMRAIGSVVATAYSDNLRLNTKRGVVASAEKGLWQNEAPIGYRRFALDKKTGATRTLDIGQRKSGDETVTLTPGPTAEVELVQWMFEQYAAGAYSLGGLARALARRRPDRKWSRTTVQSVLKNATYTGTVIWNRRPHDPEERRVAAVRPREQWITKHDAHPPLVDPALFARVQQMLERNRLTLRRFTNGGYPLTGLIRCAQCGSTYVGGGGPKNHRDPSDPDRYRFYRDSGADGSAPICAGQVGTLQKRIVEPLVIDAVASLVEDPATMAVIQAELDRALAANSTGLQGERRRMEQERDKLRAERDGIVAAVGRGVLEDRDARGRLNEIRTREESLTAELERQRFAHRVHERISVERERLLGLARDFRARAKELSGPALRELLRPWLASAVMDKHSRRLTLTMRSVPTLAFAPSTGGPGRDGQPQKRRERLVRRVIQLPPARRAAAGGSR